MYLVFTGGGNGGVLWRVGGVRARELLVPELGTRNSERFIRRNARVSICGPCDIYFFNTRMYAINWVCSASASLEHG